MKGELENPSKPWKSLDDQLALLKQRGMLTDNQEAAKSYLERLDYYRLSGYWYPFRVLDPVQAPGSQTPRRLDCFMAGSHFADVVQLYVFDKKLRLLALDTFASWLRSLSFIRNVSAHHSRLWNINVLVRASIPTDAAYWQSMNNARLFCYLCLMQLMLKVICPNTRWYKRLAAVIAEFPESPSRAVRIEDFGVVEGWQSWNLWAQK